MDELLMYVWPIAAILWALVALMFTPPVREIARAIADNIRAQGKALSD